MRISDWSSVCSSDLKMQAINRHLFEDLGYAGDHDQYYDPRNSYLNEVFERRRGNPISLAMVQMEVARRLGVPLDGVSFPGHFLVRLPVDDGVLVMDPFNRGRSEEHTSELQSLMRISYAVFCLKKKNKHILK